MTTQPTLRQGSSGTAVRTMQTRLRAHGYTVTVDGKFGPATATAVKNFQRASKLAADGVAGRNTWAALNALTRLERDARAKVILASMGWRVNTALRYTTALRSYQAMFYFQGWAALDVDGIPGPKTMAALEHSASRRTKGQGDISDNFSASEFACKCGGRYAACRRIWASRALVIGAERYRTINGPFTPVSACRCVAHNKAVGGYYRSQHIHGQAMDVVAVHHVDKVTELRAFSAIGVNRGSRSVRHLDNRHLSPDNFPKASGNLSSPYVYFYG